MNIEGGRELASCGTRRMLGIQSACSSLNKGIACSALFAITALCSTFAILDLTESLLHSDIIATNNEGVRLGLPAC